jgi:hypothetical protein
MQLESMIKSEKGKRIQPPAAGWLTNQAKKVRWQLQPEASQLFCLPIKVMSLAQI